MPIHLGRGSARLDQAVGDVPEDRDKSRPAQCQPAVGHSRRPALRRGRGGYFLLFFVFCFLFFYGGGGEGGGAIVRVRKGKKPNKTERIGK